MPDDLLCIDTNILIWGILQNGKTEKEKQMIAKATDFLERNFAARRTFAISVVTLAEFMVKVPDERKNKIMALLSKNFVILPYSINAALKASEIFRTQYGKMKNAYHGVRALVRPDMQILASALVAGSTTILTEDGPFTELASKYLHVQGIPEPPLEQPSLF